ncbi:F0F1 ATP synthase subunit delta [Endozoicomonas sp. SESOKO1]|uniref:F0F1 ATP synthase subunit delta n=1 Tax=Endozoicomonas sp. SESOKO1 TaxID=2828742 RepID=UPI0021493153|nr:F0F1 ATP synthase subunit delta [Endozoicomonas sp. SESOKO1]
MELTTCARPYAKAAFEYARDASRLSEWSDMLSLCASVTAYRKVVEMLGNPQLSGAQQAETIIGLCQGELDKPFENYLRVLSEHRRLQLLPEIAALYARLRAEEERSQQVLVTSAYPLSQEQQDKLAEKMAARLGRSVQLVTEIDSSILGGVIVKAGDLVIDGSLRARLGKLADAMIS